MKTMKNFFIAAFVSLFFITSSYAEAPKIGVIDFQRVLKESKGGKTAKAEIEKEGKAMEKKLKKEGDEIEKLQKKLEAEIMVMSKEVREEKERDFKIKVYDFKNLQKKYAQEFKTFEAKVINRIQKEVFELVERVGKIGGYQIIVERSMVLYYPDSIDITDTLIREYNAIK